MTRFLLVAPLIIPMATAVLMLLRRDHVRFHRTAGVCGSALLLAAGLALLMRVYGSGIQALQIGRWPAPFGITFVADMLSAIMVVLTGLMGLAVGVYSLGAIDLNREKYGYHPITQILLMGVCGSFLTGDIFNLYVWFEVMLISSFVLLALGGRRAQLEGAMKYVTINLVGSALFLAASGILYGVTGTLNMADLAVVIRDSGEHHALVTMIGMLYLVAFGIKAGVFPLFFWLPASYHTPPFPTAALFSGLLTKVGVYALLRVFTLIFTLDTAYTHSLILAISLLTMVTGVLGAAAQNEFRRILSFHIVSQIGYMILGLGLYTPLALAGSVFYLIHHIIVKTNLFLVAGLAHRISGTNQLPRMGGLYRDYPGLAVLFFIPAFSLAGIPPLSGFWAKFVLIKAGLAAGEYLAVGVALGVSLLTVFSMTKIWAEAFWKKAPQSIEANEELQDAAGMEEPRSGGRLLWYYLPITALAVLTVLIGFFAEPLMRIASVASEQLLNPSDYIRTVLGRGEL